MKKGKYVILSIMVAFVLTVSISYSYFANRVKVTGNDGKKINNLYITNGNAKVEIDTSNSSWKCGGNNIDGSILNPEDGLEVNYEGVKITNKSNLTANMDLSLLFKGEKIGGTEEGKPNIPEDDVDVDHREDTPGFDLLVGDIDNLGFGYNGIDPFTQITPVHSLDVYPRENDAQGTDRKMATTGFYNLIKKSKKGNMGNKWSCILYQTKSGITFGENGNWRTEAYKWPLVWNTKDPRNGWCCFGGYFYEKEDGTWTEESKFYDDYWKIDTNKIGRLVEDNGEIFFDGYTNSTLGKHWNHSLNGVNWGDFQKVEPLKFVYSDKIEKDKKVSSATIQVMFDDVQPQPSDDFVEYKKNDGDWIVSAYSPKSTNKYQVTLEVEGNPKYPAVRVQEFEEIINNIDQHGPRANLVTFEVPKRLLKYVENGGDGLLLKLDDPRDGTIYTGMVNADGSIVGKNYDGTEIKKGDIAGGDSYAIDFAKIIVNKDINRSSNIKGKVTDKEGNPIRGAVITGSGIEGYVTTDANGEYFIEDVAPGQVILKVTHPAYNDRMCTIYHLGDNETVILNIQMLPKGTTPIISAETKFTGNIIVNKYKKGSNVAIGDPISKEIKIVKSGEEYSIEDTALKVEPGYYYKVDYKLKLVSQGKIDVIADEFKLKFDSSIKAKVTQENNPSLSESGT